VVVVVVCTETFSDVGSSERGIGPDEGDKGGDKGGDVGKDVGVTSELI
jgi:hypothetical protein